MDKNELKAISEKTERILKLLNVGLYEREKAINLSYLSMVAGEAIFLLGPPGVGKSLMARRLSRILKSGKAFEYLMHRFSTPDEIFGPVSIQKLKNEDKYERSVIGYLPDADIAFLDEIWKAGPSIQNTLLTIINERIFRNGDIDVKVPLKGLMAASNELPAKNQGLEALWDRFILRLMVTEVRDQEFFNAMIQGKDNLLELQIDDKTKITDDDLVKWKKAIDDVKIPQEILNTITAIKHRLNEYNNTLGENQDLKIYVSDRKWKKIIRILKTSALLNGRDEANLLDAFLISDCIWNNNTQIEKVNELVETSIHDFSFRYSIDFSGLNEELENLKTEIDRITVNKNEKETKALKTFVNNGIDYFNFQKVPVSYGYNDTRNYEFIKVEDFNNLTNNMRVPLFLNDFKSDVFTVSSSKGYKIKIHLSNSEIDRTIKSESVKYNEFVFSTPSVVHVQEWDKTINEILKEVDDDLFRLQKIENEKLEGLNSNYFVDAQKSKIISSSIDDTKKSLLDIKTEAKRLQKHYKSIKDGEIKDTNLPKFAIDEKIENES